MLKGAAMLLRHAERRRKTREALDARHAARVADAKCPPLPDPAPIRPPLHTLYRPSICTQLPASRSPAPRRVGRT